MHSISFVLQTMSRYTMNIFIRVAAFYRVSVNFVGGQIRIYPDRNIYKDRRASPIVETHYRGSLHNVTPKQVYIGYLI